MLETDLGAVLDWRNHPDIRRFMLTSHEISNEEHRAWFREASVDSYRRLLIFELAGNPMGFVQFRLLPQAAAEWGFYVSPEAPRGAGRRLGRAALAYAFAELELEKVIGKALPNNERSISFHLSLGFRRAVPPSTNPPDEEMIELELPRWEWMHDQSTE